MAVLAVLLDLLLPARCPLCRAVDGADLCTACLSRLPCIPEPCPWCACPHGLPLCPDCGGGGLPHLDRVIAAWAYRDGAEALVGAAKAAARPAAVRAVACRMPDPPADLAVDAVTPVPPAPGRRPGPHLASACARILARRLHRPLRRLLVQVRPAAPQHRLGREERWRNVDGLFACRGPVPRRILLVDDLCTSGATASAAAAALRAAGAGRVALAVFARTPVGL